MIFFSDIDNTLVYSHNRNLFEPKIVVEYLRGKEQAYMTRKTYNYFLGSKDLIFIPVTSRHIEQYKRLIPFTDGSFYVKYALLCNGGILLNENIINKEWLNTSLKISEKSFAEIEKCYRLMKKMVSVIHIHRIQPFFIYVVIDDAEKMMKLLQENLDEKKVIIWRDGRKVYCCSTEISKGKSIKRFMKYLGKQDITFSAGDNIIDVSMLNITDYSFAKIEIKQLVNAVNVTYLKGDYISDQICDLLNIYERESRE